MLNFLGFAYPYWVFSGKFEGRAEFLREKHNIQNKDKGNEIKKGGYCPC